MDTKAADEVLVSPASAARRKSLAVLNFKERTQTILGRITLGDLALPESGVVVVKSSESLTNAFEKLLQHHILSAPVENEKGTEYLGFMDTCDLVSSVLSLHKAKSAHADPMVDLGDFVSRLGSLRVSQDQQKQQHHHHHHQQQQQQQQTQQHQHQLHPTHKEIQSPPPRPRRSSSNEIPLQTATQATNTLQLDVWTPTYLARLHPLRTATSSTTLLELCKVLAAGTQRVIELDHKGKAVRVVSQSWLTAAVHDLLEEIDGELGSVPVSNLPISALGLVPKEVHCCRKTQPTIEAFELMLERNVSSVAIVDENKVLLGHISASALKRVLETRDMTLLDKPLCEFLESSPRGLTATSISTHATVSEMLDRLVERETHRLFLVDDAGVVVGVCSLRDVLRSIFN